MLQASARIWTKKDWQSQRRSGQHESQGNELQFATHESRGRRVTQAGKQRQDRWTTVARRDEDEVTSGESSIRSPANEEMGSVESPVALAASPSSSLLLSVTDGAREQGREDRRLIN